jgi:hypothetical protein
MPTNHSLKDPASVGEPDLPHAAPAHTTLPRYLFIASADGAPAGSDPCQRIQQAATALNGWVERLASPFGEGMIYTICQLPSNRAAASLATVIRSVYATEVRTVALPRSRQIYDRA